MKKSSLGGVRRRIAANSILREGVSEPKEVSTIEGTRHPCRGSTEMTRDARERDVPILEDVGVPDEGSRAATEQYPTHRSFEDEAEFGITHRHERSSTLSLNHCVVLIQRHYLIEATRLMTSGRNRYVGLEHPIGGIDLGRRLASTSTDQGYTFVVFHHNEAFVAKQGLRDGRATIVALSSIVRDHPAGLPTICTTFPFGAVTTKGRH